MSITPEQKKIVDESIAKLLEHFESVQVFITGHVGGDQITSSYDAGGGNFYSRLGQIKEWVLIQDQYTRTFADIQQRQTSDGNNEEDTEP